MGITQASQDLVGCVDGHSGYIAQPSKAEMCR
jgi:hypothetical protein